MKIEPIIYETTRQIYSVEDKLSIATIFLFCYKYDSKLFAELLYAEKHDLFISFLNHEYKEYKVDFSIKLDDKNVRNAFYETIEVVKKKYDKDGYHKALFEKDEFALVVYELTNVKFDQIAIKKMVKKTFIQMALDFKID
jgi:hypothetical protein